MNPDTALSILQQATAQAALPLIGHQQVQEALKVIAEALKPKDEG